MDDQIIKLIQSVSALEARVEGLQDSMIEIKSTLTLVSTGISNDSASSDKMMRLTWAALGACIGAGGTEALKTALTLFGG